MNSVSVQEYIIVTRGTGKYYIDSKRAEKIVLLVNSQNKPAIVEIDGQYIAVNDIIGIITPRQFEDYQRQKSGEWKCQHGNWQEKNMSHCRCMWGKQPKATDVHEELSKEQKDRGALIKKLVENGMKMSEMKDLKVKTNNELAEIILNLEKR